MPNTPDLVIVADLLPFFRYAVGPASNSHPAIPFYSLNGARKFFDETRKELPWSGVVLYKRTWAGMVEIDRYTPRPLEVLKIQPIEPKKNRNKIEDAY